MATRGRKPKPTALKRATGNPGKRKLPADEPRFDQRVPAAPSGSPAAVRQFYADYAQRLVDSGVMTVADHAVFLRLAESHWIAGTAATKLRKEPFTREDENGIERKSPWLQIWRDATTVEAKLSAEFGLTPSARSRVSAQGKQEKSLAELLFEHVETPIGG